MKVRILILTYRRIYRPETGKTPGSARLLHIGDTLGDCQRKGPAVFIIARRSLGLQQHQSHPSRLRGKRGKANLEVTLHKQESANTWWAFACPARKLTAGDKINFTEEFSANVLEMRIEARSR